MTALAAMVQPQEEWRPVVGYEGRYLVSSLGRIASLRCRSGLRPQPMIRRPQVSHGYHVIALEADGEHLYAKVHRLVLEAFVGPCPPGHQGAHLNGVRTDNRPSNLVWATPKENMRHQAVHGTLARGHRHGAYTKPESRTRGVRNGNAKLSEQSVLLAFELHRQGAPVPKIAARLGVVATAIHKVLRRQSWAHVAAPDSAKAS